MAIQIIREQKTTYNEFGASANSEETYIKVSSELKSMLATLKGAHLSAFFALALNEAEISFGQSSGLSLREIEKLTGFSSRHVLRAVRFLTANHYAVESAELGTHGEKLYRVYGMAWFGNKAPLTASNSQPQPAPASNRRTQRASASNSGRGDKMSYPVQNVRGVTCYDHDDDDLEQPDHSVKTSSSFMAREIFANAGFAGANLVELGKSVDEKTAQAWADWVVVCDHSVYHNPHGYAWKCLIADPTTQPPATRKQKTWMDGFEQFVQR